MSLKLSDRKKVLKRIVIPEKNLIELGEHYETSNLDEISSYFEQAISRNEEGVIVKQTDSFYKLFELESLRTKLKSHLIKYDQRIKPRYLVNWNPTVTDKPD